MAKENLQSHELIAQLSKQRSVVNETILLLNTGYGLPGHLELLFMDNGLSDLFSELLLANEAALKPLLEKKSKEIDSQIKSTLEA